MKKVKVEDLKVDDSFVIRSQLNEDAIERYIELYQSGNEKAIIAQAKTQKVIDGFHRLAVAKRLKLDKVSVEFVDVKDQDIRALAYKLNRAHGVPISRGERDQLICDLYFKDDKTEQQIADIVRLDQSVVSRIISNMQMHNGNIGKKKADKRRKLTEKNKIAISRHLLGGEGQQEVAERFGVSQAKISKVWSEIRDNVHKLYTKNKLLKREVSEKTGFTLEEVDKILQGYGDPLNFETMTTTWWPAFGLDKRFGTKQESNLPADLVKNIFALYTDPGGIILDPAAGGGVTLDVANDMVNRRCFAYDILPKRKDIEIHNILVEKPTEPKKPDLIFLDLPYGPAKKGEYSVAHFDDLANKTPAQFLEDLKKIFGYWDSGVLVVLMSSFRGGGTLIDLPFEAEKRMVDAGWKIVEHIVNEYGHMQSDDKNWDQKARAGCWLLRRHIHILVGEKKKRRRAAVAELIPIESIRPNSWNPNTMSAEVYKALLGDMHANGPTAINPILIRPVDDGFEIVDGYNRWRAAKELGWHEIPANVKEMTEEEARITNFRKNSERGTLDPMKEAMLFKDALDEGRTQQQAAEMYGRTQQFISSRLVLLRLPEKIQRKITTRVVTPSHGELLARLPDEEAMRSVAERIVRCRLPVPIAEKWTKWYDKLGELKGKYPKEGAIKHLKGEVEKRVDVSNPPMLMLKQIELDTQRKLERLEKLKQSSAVASRRLGVNTSCGPPKLAKKFEWGLDTIRRDPRWTKEKLLGRLSDGSTFGGFKRAFAEEWLTLHATGMSIREKLEKCNKNCLSTVVGCCDAIYALKYWFGVGDSEIEIRLNEHKKEHLDEFIKETWTLLKMKVEEIKDYIFHKEGFKKTLKRAKEIYKEYFTACAELGVKPKTEPDYPLWRDPRYVNLGELTVVKLAEPEETENPYRKTHWRLDWDDQNFPVRDVKKALEKDLSKVRQQERELAKKSGGN